MTDILSKLMAQSQAMNLLLDEPFMCPSCGKEKIKYKYMKQCIFCENDSMLIEERKIGNPIINKDTEYEGKDWDFLINGSCGSVVKQVKKAVTQDYYNILICGVSKGVGKTNTAMIIAHHERMKGKKVIYTLQKDTQDKMTAEGEDAYHVCQKLKDCDILIVDEIGRGVGDSRWHRGNWHSVIDHRIMYHKSTILIGNVKGILKTGNDGVYASEFFDGDRLKEYTAFEYIGNSNRGRKYE